MSAQQDHSVLQAWWGQSDWQSLRELRGLHRAKLVCDRIKSEFGYKSVLPWPIHGKKDGRGRVMYYMIHATDHSEAPNLMHRAYHKAVVEKEPPEQFQFEFETWKSLRGGYEESSALPR